MFAVCVGQDKTFEAIEKVLTEVSDLFPAPVLHIGGDEYDMSVVSSWTVHWGECPHCRALSALDHPLAAPYAEIAAAALAYQKEKSDTPKDKAEEFDG